ILRALIHPREVRRVRWWDVRRLRRRLFCLGAAAVARRGVAAVVAGACGVDAGRGRGDGPVGRVTTGGEAEQERAGRGGAEEAAGHGCAFRECVRSPTRYPGIVQLHTDSARLW